MRYINTINLQEILENPNSLLSDSIKELKNSTDKISDNHPNTQIIFCDETHKD